MPFFGAPKYGDKKIEASEADLLIDKLKTLISEEELFKDADLKIAEVAGRLKIMPHKASQLINDNMGKSFAVFINEHRIEESKRLIRTNQNITLEAIGYDCGFNSKSTFYTAFKKVTGTTPAKYKDSLSKTLS